MKILDLINKVHARENLSYEESQYCMREIMSGNILPSQFGALMSAMALKEETATELAGMASIMREYSLKIKSKENSIDVCGTGGSGLKWFNISTASALSLIHI